jgi:SRSO17 transposase
MLQEWENELRKLQSRIPCRFARPQPRGRALSFDETGFLKRGNKSVGVKRQYSATAGGTEDGQVGVFLCYASASGAAFIDRALYLPREWAKDQLRRAEAAIPEEVSFTTKPALAHRMLERAFEAGVPARWVVAEALYGSDRSLRMFLERREQPFVLAVKSDESLWTLTDRGPAQVRADELLASEIRPGGGSRLEQAPKANASTSGHLCLFSGCN